MTLLIFVFAAVALVGGFLSATRFRQLVDYEFSNFRDAWLADGRPIGGAASRKEATFAGSGFAAQRCFNRWLFSDPSWLGEAGAPRTFLRDMRLGSIFLALSLMGLGLIALLST